MDRIDRLALAKDQAVGGLHRRRDIQGLRAVAVLCVVFFHAGLPVPGGFLGVDVFFVISGFVITAMLRREWTTAGRLRLRTFYARRFKRLTPALALMVSVTVVLSGLFLSPLGNQTVVAQTALGAIFFSANFVIAKTTGGYFDAAADTNPLLNTWSLSVEEQFYLVFPLLLVLGWVLVRRSRRFRHAPLAIVSLVALSSFLVAVATSGGIDLLGKPTAFIGFYSPINRAWEFAAGAFLALVAVRSEGRSRLAGLCGAMGLGILAASLWIVSSANELPGFASLLPVSGALLLILAGSLGRNPVSRVLGTPPMVVLGDLSYSWYLWHWPFIVFALLLWPGRPWAAVASAVVSLVPALVSYRWVEKPVRYSLPSGGPSFRKLVAFTVIPPVALAAGLWIGASNFFWLPQVRDYGTQMAEQHVGFVGESCGSKRPFRERDMELCKWNASATGEPIYLVGDSNAMHLIEGVIGAGETLNRPVFALTGAECPFIDVYIRYPDPNAKTSDCRDYYYGMLEWIAKSPRGLVVISSADFYWRDPRYVISRDPAFTTADSSGNVSMLDEGLEATVKSLQESGHSVLLVETVPHFTEEPFAFTATDCSIAGALVGRLCRQDMPLEAADEMQARARHGIESVAAKTGVPVLDFRDFFCPGGTCATQGHGLPLYQLDGYHITVGASRLLDSEFARAFKQIR